MLTLSRLLDYALSFVRNILLARLLTKADFGLVLLLSLTATLLEFASRLALGRQLIQSKLGKDTRFLASIHGFQFLAGISSAVLIVCLSPAIAAFVNHGEMWWAFALLGLVPFSKGLQNLEVERRQRDMDFTASAIVLVVPQIVAVALVYPLAKWVGGVSAVLWLMIVKCIVGVVLSHWLSRAPYTWAWDWPQFRSIFSFSWPLLINGFLLVACQQGDQLIVAAFFSLEALAVYGLAFALAGIPRMIGAQVGSSLLLPLLSRVQDEAGEFRLLVRSGIELTGFISAMVYLPLLMAGAHLLELFYGSRYSGGASYLAIFSVAGALRLLRMPPTVAAMARGDTKATLYSNLWRNLSLLFAFCALLVGWGLVSIALSAVVGELCSLVYAMKRLVRTSAVQWSDASLSWSFVTALLILASGFSYFQFAGDGLLIVMGSTSLFLLLGGVVGFWILPSVSQSRRLLFEKFSVLQR